MSPEAHIRESKTDTCSFCDCDAEDILDTPMTSLCSHCLAAVQRYKSAHPQWKPAPSEGLKYDTGKLRYSLVPVVAIKGIAEVLTFGAAKYGPNNWQLVDNAVERYTDALYRHLEAYRVGESTDPESGLPHLAHAATNVAFLQYFEDKESDNG